MHSDGKAATLKARAVEELKVFWVVTIFLALMFGAFAAYRRLILHEVGINYFHYGAAMLEALIVAKVILIGKAIGVGRRFRHSRLIVSVLFQALVYGAFVAVFAVIEHWVEGLVHGQDLATVWRELMGLGKDEILARMLVIIVAFIPFFAFWEANEAMGENRLIKLLLKPGA